MKNNISSSNFKKKNQISKILNIPRISQNKTKIILIKAKLKSNQVREDFGSPPIAIVGPFNINPTKSSTSWKVSQFSSDGDYGCMWGTTCIKVLS